ncbi:N-acetylmuramoyl-L-alanine amidase family protein [Anaerosinus gibii]|uniref:N-acetylmuramoyl-L-alanine amidase n=1 Tax=Selenobaculum gibii TaxID=3054208 RepID=A0A9Y2ETP1_9FIRM|nr:N-acetylmuramoyl-L-alanine amidase [Selenobaculum gbiensis]WIW71866.1 N-acetylmuramoyl-L-alanine amidase [Selenobaculum gbiensis]
MKKIYYILIVCFIASNFGLNDAYASSLNNENINQAKVQISSFLEKVAKTFLENLKKEYLNSDVKLNEKNESLAGKKILIDPGHGGTNPGAVSYGFREVDNNLAVSLKLKTLLEKQGANVLLTRYEDENIAERGSSLREELQARVDISREYQPDIFVSIHTNSNENPNIQGAMTFYYDEESKKLANSIQTGLINSIKATDKGIAKENFYVLRNSEIPAVLVEMGFITNKNEAEKLNSDNYRDLIAQGISKGISEYFSK